VKTDMVSTLIMTSYRYFLLVSVDEQVNVINDRLCRSL